MRSLAPILLLLVATACGDPAKSTDLPLDGLPPSDHTVTDQRATDPLSADALDSWWPFELRWDAPLPDLPDLPPTDLQFAEVPGDLSFDGPTDTTEPQSCPEVLPGEVLGALTCDELAEASGLVASRVQPGILWAHNDSGDWPRVFALHEDGTHRGTWQLASGLAVDCEALAIHTADDGTETLYLADTGDNGKVREEVWVSRFAEPTVPFDGPPVSGTIDLYEQLNLVYVDGQPRDCEAFFVDPATGDLVLIDKQTEILADVFLARAEDLSTTQAAGLEYLTTLPLVLATAADISPAGDQLLVKNYFEARYYTRAPGQSLTEAFAHPCTVPVVFETQGETVAFAADGSGYYTVSEGAFAPIYFYAFATESR